MDEKPWFHKPPVELIKFNQRCLRRNSILNSRILSRIRTALADKPSHEHTRPNQLGRKWREGVYVNDAHFQLNCTEKDGLVMITSMMYDRRAFKSLK